VERTPTVGSRVASSHILEAVHVAGPVSYKQCGSIVVDCKRDRKLVEGSDEYLVAIEQIPDLDHVVLSSDNNVVVIR
jgi:hypothetical protein